MYIPTFGHRFDIVQWVADEYYSRGGEGLRTKKEKDKLHDQLGKEAIEINNSLKPEHKAIT